MLLSEFIKDFGIKKYFRTTKNIKYSLISNFIQLVLEGDWIGDLEIPKDFSQNTDINKYFTQLDTESDTLRFGDVYIILSPSRYHYGIYIDSNTVLEQPNHLNPQHEILKYNLLENTISIKARGHDVIWLRPLNEKNIFPIYMQDANAYFISTIAAMKTIDLPEGMIVATNGYYSADDGGGAKYKIVTGNYIDNGGSYHLLENGNFAKLITKSNVSVKSFGAKGDDTADDTISIQATIDFINDNGGGSVYLPTGTYKITDYLTLKNKASLKGDGLSASVIHQSTINKDGLRSVISTPNILEIKISDLKIIGTESGSGIGIHITGSPTCYVTFENILVRLFGSHGIHLAGSIVSNLRKVLVADNGGDGIYIDGTLSPVTSTLLDNCYANSNALIGINIERATYVALNCCAADLNNIGYLLKDVTGGTLTACGAEKNITNSFKLRGDFYGARSISYIGCYSYESGSDCFDISGYSHAVIQGCSAEHTGGTYSLNITAASSATLIDPYFDKIIGGGGRVNLLSANSSGNFGIGTTLPNNNAILDIVSTTKAFMLPRMTTTQRNAIASPTEGMFIYNLTTHVLDFYNGTEWGTV